VVCWCYIKAPYTRVPWLLPSAPPPSPSLPPNAHRLPSPQLHLNTPKYHLTTASSHHLSPSMSTMWVLSATPAPPALSR
jgi:hypothetical protein